MGNLSTGTHNGFILLLRVSKIVRTGVTQMENLVLLVDRPNNLVSSLEIIDHIVRDGSDGLDGGALNHESRLRTQWLPLGADDLTTCLGIRLQLIILCLPQAELFCAAGRLHVLHTDVDTLPDDATINLKR